MDTENIKMDQTVTPEGRSFLAASTFILAVLLTGTVGTLIYTQLHSSAGACHRQTQATDPDITEHVHFVNTEQEPIDDEEVSYNRNENIAIYLGEDGSFNLQDYNKGLHISKMPDNGLCLVMPATFTSQDGYSLESFLADKDGQNITMTSEEDIMFQLLPGKIDDVSFISPAAHKHCTDGYQWMVKIPAAQDGAMMKLDEHSIAKRDRACVTACIRGCVCGFGYCACAQACATVCVGTSSPSQKLAASSSHQF